MRGMGELWIASIERRMLEGHNLARQYGQSKCFIEFTLSMDVSRLFLLRDSADQGSTARTGFRSVNNVAISEVYQRERSSVSFALIVGCVHFEDVALRGVFCAHSLVASTGVLER